MEEKLNNYTKKCVQGNSNRGAHFCGQFALALFLALHGVVGNADIPKLYGKQYVKSGESWSDAGTSTQGIAVSIVDTVPNTAYRRQLEQYESDGGPYADSLAEPLFGLGKYYAGRGDYKEAVALYRRALHNVRLNDGLYSERQAPIVRELLDTVRLSGDLNALDDRYDYFFGLYGKGRPPYTELRMRAALEYLRWQREAIRLGIDANEHKRLLGLYKLNEDLLEGAIASISISIEDRWKLALSQIRNLYLLQSKVAPRVEVTAAGTISTFSVQSGQDNELNFDQRKLESIRRNALVRGTEVLEQYALALDSGASLESDKASKLEKKARVMLELGDWHQWNGSYRRADEYYVSAAQLLNSGGEAELAQKWFADPVELPDNGAYWQPSADAGKEAPLRITATYDVSIRGRVRNLSTPDPDPETRGLVNRFKRELKGTRFRPRYKNGQAIVTENQSREYEVYR